MLNMMSRYVRNIDNKVEWVKIISIDPHLQYVAYKQLFSNSSYYQMASKHVFESQFKEVI